MVVIAKKSVNEFIEKYRETDDRVVFKSETKRLDKFCGREESLQGGGCRGEWFVRV